jgi:hypothetical protein
MFPARVQVHWTYVTARFSNHESLFEATSTEQLNEPILTAHIELHSSRSSSGSVKKPALDGIEEAEEVTTPERKKEREVQDDDSTTLAVPNAYPARNSSLFSAGTSESLLQTATEDAALSALPPSATRHIDIPEVNVTMDQTDPSEETVHEEPQGRYSMALNPMNNYSSLGVDRRMSTQSARPSTADMYDQSFYESLYKPKVKLGPRPSLSYDKRSPAGGVRAVATLPAGLRSSSRPVSRQALPSRTQSSSSRTQNLLQSRPTTRDSSSYQSFKNFPAPPPIPETSEYIQRPKSSSNSVKSLPATLSRSPGMTREKQRLMKFREMYKEKENQRAKGVDAHEPTTPTKSKAPMSSRTAPNSELSIHDSIDDHPNGVTNDVPAQPDPDHPKSDSAVCMDQQPVVSDLRKPGQNGRESPDQLVHDEGEQTPDIEHTNTGAKNASQTASRNAADSAHSASTPTSALESSRPNSTRPTSVSDTSDHDKAIGAETDAERGTEAATPSTVGGISSLEDPEENDVKGDAPAAAPEVKTPVSKVFPSTVDEIRDDESITPTAETTFPVVANTTEDSENPAHDAPRRRREIPAPLSIAEGDRSSITSYDDDLMDELHKAEVQEALTVSVSKSPITSYSPRRPSVTVRGESYRSDDSSPHASPKNKARVASPQDSSPPPVYKPTFSNMPSPLPSSSSPVSNSSSTNLFRSTSGPLLSPITEPSPELITVPKRMKIGGGVAAKIADLQRSFSRSSANSTISPTSAPRTSTSRKSSLMSQRANSPQNLPSRNAPQMQSTFQYHPSAFNGRAVSRGSFESHDTASTSPRNNSSSSIGKLDNRRLSAYNLPQIEPKAETISVKATIIRTDGPVRPELLPQQESSQLQLHESPLVISHQKAPSPVKEERIEALPPVDPVKHRRARSSISQLLPGLKSSSTLTLSENALNSPTGRRESLTFPQVEGSWRSMGRRRSERSESKSPTRAPISPGGSMGRSMSSDSFDSVATNESTKKGSKSSRLMKRMSNSLSSIASVTRLPLALNSHSVREEEQEPVTEKSKPAGFDIGDLNVQFPDTLVSFQCQTRFRSTANTRPALETPLG